MDQNAISLLVCLSKDLRTMKTDKVGIRDVTGALAVMAADWLQVGAEELFMPLGSIRRHSAAHSRRGIESQGTQDGPARRSAVQLLRAALLSSLLSTIYCLIFTIHYLLFTLLLYFTRDVKSWAVSASRLAMPCVAVTTRMHCVWSALALCNFPERLLDSTYFILD